MFVVFVKFIPESFSLLPENKGNKTGGDRHHYSVVLLLKVNVLKTYQAKNSGR